MTNRSEEERVEKETDVEKHEKIWERRNERKVCNYYGGKNMHYKIVINRNEAKIIKKKRKKKVEEEEKQDWCGVAVKRKTRGNRRRGVGRGACCEE